VPRQVDRCVVEHYLCSMHDWPSMQEAVSATKTNPMSLDARGGDASEWMSTMHASSVARPISPDVVTAGVTTSTSGGGGDETMSAPMHFAWQFTRGKCADIIVPYVYVHFKMTQLQTPSLSHPSHRRTTLLATPSTERNSLERWQ
jgi:hypothetical protein